MGEEMKITLLESLTSALNRLYDGNTITIEHDEGVSHVDRYICDCGAVVKEEDWNAEHKQCNQCYSDMMCEHGHRWGAR